MLGMKVCADEQETNFFWKSLITGLLKA